MCSYSWRVPSYAFGKLRVVASGDLGELGPKEGAAVIYNWNPLYSVAGLLPWLLVIAAIVLLKENRRGQALWILLPLVALKGVLFGIFALMSMPSEIAEFFHTIADCLLIGFVMNWLLGQRIGNRNRFVTWLLAIVVFAAVWAVSLVDTGLTAQVFAVCIFIGISISILMISFVLGGFLSRKKFSPVRFCVWTALWVIVFTFALFLVVGLFQILLMDIGYAAEMLIGVLIGGGIYAGIMVAALLPFEIVLFVNSFWRQRFEAVFGLKAPTPPAVEQEATVTA